MDFSPKITPFKIRKRTKVANIAQEEKYYQDEEVQEYEKIPNKK